MSGIDPDNGDPLENPEPEADSVQPGYQEQEDAEGDSLEAESEAAAWQASNFGTAQGYADPQVNQDPETTGSQAVGAESKTGSQETSNFAVAQSDNLSTLQELEKTENDVEVQSNIGYVAASARKTINSTEDSDSECTEKSENNVQREDVENHIADDEVVNTAESYRDRFRESTQAEDEQDLPNVGNPEFTGAEWSLEPEDSINNQINTGEGAEGGDVVQYEMPNDEVESQRLESLETHRTESDSQLISIDIFTGAQGTESLKLETVAPQLLVESLGAAADVSDENDWETNSLPEEEDYYYGPEGDNCLNAGGQAGTELLETEADQEIELSAGAASAFIKGDWNPSNSVGFDVSCPECVEIQTDNHGNVGLHTADLNENVDIRKSFDDCEVNEAEEEGAGIQDEICLTDQAKKDKTESESYEPECDQSIRVSCQTSESSQSESNVNEKDPSIVEHISEQAEIVEQGSNEESNVILTEVIRQSADVANNCVETETQISSVSTGCDISNQLELGNSDQDAEKSDIKAQNATASNTVEPIRYSLENISQSEQIVAEKNEKTECENKRELVTDGRVSEISEAGAIPKYSNFQTTERKGSNPSIVYQNSNDVKSSLKDESSGIDSEEELLSELDKTLECNTDKTSLNGAISGKDEFDKNICCEQCARNSLKCSLPNGFWHRTGTNFQDVKNLKRQLHQAKQLLLERECEISRLKEDVEEKVVRYETVILERDTYQKEVDCLKHQKTDDLYLPQIKELEYTIAQQQTEVRGLKDKLSSHDSAAKKAIAALQSEMKLRVDQITKTCEEATREKDAMVVKYAQAEHKNLEYLKRAERLDIRVKEVEKEKEGFVGKFKAVKEHRTKIGAELEAKIAELSNAHKELDKQREQLSSADTRVKWAQNKLKAELEAHKETKVQLEKANVKIKEAKEETQQIRSDCQAIIKTYQESEEVKSNSLDKELKQKESELLAHQQQQNNTELVHVKTLRELEQIKADLKDSKTENVGLKEKINKLETEKDQSQFTVNKYSEIIQRQKKEIGELREKIENMVHLKSDFSRAQELIKTLDSEIADLKVSNKDLTAETEACRRRETDKLELTAKLSRKNAELQSENTTLSNKVLNLTGELQTLKMESQDNDTKLKDLSDALDKEKKLREEESQSLNTKLAGKCKAVEDLTRRVEEEKDEIKTLKRKHANNMKDLTRQLQQVRRKLDNYEVTSNGDKDTLSLGSRTSSNGSLNTVGLPEQNNVPVTTPNVAVHSQPAHHVRQASPEQEYPVITEQVEVDKQLLIERIVKVQKLLARKNEKLEFMEDHITQLVDEIQKKNKIIQNYILREEAGTMTSDIADHMKAELSRKHSIMGSLYGSHPKDGTMTLDLSLEINRKLQAVLEDTLLKNMTLKESLDTLGQEIARLSQENRNLQLKQQGKHHTRTRPR